MNDHNDNDNSNSNSSNNDNDNDNNVLIRMAIESNLSISPHSFLILHPLTSRYAFNYHAVPPRRSYCGNWYRGRRYSGMGYEKPDQRHQFHRPQQCYHFRCLQREWIHDGNRCQGR